MAHPCGSAVGGRIVSEAGNTKKQGGGKMRVLTVLEELRHALGTGGALLIALSLPLAAQVQTSTTVTHGPATKSITVERGEIVAISGNSVVIKMDDGTIKEFDDVPESTTFMVNGQPVNIKTAKVGMKLEKQTVTTTTPKVVTTVETVTGKVFHVTPPSSVILTLENGQNQQFKIPQGQKFMINGQETDAWGLRKGMNVTAQRVTEVPEVVVAEQIKRTGSAPPPPPAPQAGEPILIVAAAPASAPTESASATLPKTASNVPLIGLLGALFCALSLIAMAIRTIVSRSIISQ
jgi:hypothetical protein